MKSEGKGSGEAGSNVRHLEITLSHISALQKYQEVTGDHLLLGGNLSHAAIPHVTG